VLPRRLENRPTRQPRFTDAGNVKNIRWVDEVSKQMIEAGLIVLVSSMIQRYLAERGVLRNAGLDFAI